MGAEAKETAFVNDPTAFAGAELVTLLVTRGHQVFALLLTPGQQGIRPIAGASYG
jgi:hypothetical protein